MSTDAFAQPKAIGTDIETLVVNALGVLDAADNDDAHHDAVTAGLLEPSSLDARVPVVFAGTPLVEAGTLVEIKAAKRWTSNGSGDVRGRWVLKGRDAGQHATLLDSAAIYALTVYETTPDDERRLLAIAIIPATLLDEHLRGRWRDTDRREGTLAKLGWPHVLARVLGGDGA
ncbi:MULTISPECIES: hypothetical protein [unclassified Haloarcula]|uniref:hypothetical protein n=1 Tax=unclassified Haloarcula TaxID=2624677 RepID=UPI000EF1F527|nr:MULTISPECIES: hypothetical protein [unclassified Haloarcula]RLM33500.1 hypothetical protein DVK01_17740 [Haloarcula sp. Atlit-120R]RLM42099.1 hypothetical protein DVK00_16995 [Haloarcula sp. Atlit-47R]